MPEVTIVALPEASDRIRKISSEKEPHLTLLFLGKVSDDDLQQIIEYVQHTCETSLRPFGLSGDFRGPLGPDNADVLFFEKDSSNIEVPVMARDYFLKNDAVRKGYNSVEQYPEWTPHLTLGYPDSPAKPDKDDVLRYSWVSFDRIAVWFKDYDGIEFRLKQPRSYFEEVAMSEAVTDLLEHHGVKGMKWGVRNDRGHVGERATNKKIAKEDAKFEKAVASANSGRLTPEFHNAIVSRMNSRVQALNESDKYRDVDFTIQTGKIKNDYDRDAQEVIMRSFEDATKEHYGSNASGTKKAVYNRETDRIDIVEIKKNVNHAEEQPTVPDVSVKLKRNKTGHIVNQTITVIEDSIEQSDQVDDWLEHFGIKGMKWGVRKQEVIAVEVSSKPGRMVTTTGGQNLSPHEDAIKVAISKQKAKTSTTDSLSTKELQELVNRMNLEQQYSNLTNKNKKDAFKSLDDGRKKVDTVLNAANTYGKVQQFLNTPSGKIIKETLVSAVKSKVRGR